MEDNKFVFVETSETESEKIAAPEYSYWKSVFRKFFASKVAILMLIIITAVLLMAIIHPMISNYDHLVNPNINNKETHFLPISLEHPFGTDDTGRDVFSMIWSGARVSLFVAISATLITNVIGVIVGMFWGYSQKVDKVMIQVYNVISNVPFTLIVMVMAFVLGAGVPQLILALSITSWVGTAYFIRVQVMIIRDREYNLASRTLGSSTPKIILHNILPYLVSVLVTSLSRDIPLFISYEVFLGYIGVGLGQQTASLGRIIEEHSLFMQSSPSLFLIPVAVTAIISVSLYIVGQTLADASDPKNHMI
ncbi:MAG: ABC transporter permease [Tissierellia bacterium]|nr:ABC transporter permease [Tissierellia bacterium]